jgi:hypothetical protein
MMIPKESTMPTETSFTQGPWKKAQTHGSIFGADGVLVATTGYRVEVGSVEDDANAALITAAPELFDVLATLTYWHDQGHIDESWWVEARAVLAAARKVA